RSITRARRTRPSHRLLNNRLAAAIIASRVRPQLLKKTGGHYPAVTKALEIMTRGISKSVPETLALEREAILELVQTDTCRNVTRLVLRQERAKNQTIPGADRDNAVSASNGDRGADANPIPRTAAIGAGLMGSGIAQWLSARQLQVILRDI